MNQKLKILFLIDTQPPLIQQLENISHKQHIKIYATVAVCHQSHFFNTLAICSEQINIDFVKLLEEMPPKTNSIFIIKGKKETLLPADDPNFDQSVETKVSFTQGCNLFISMVLIYESIKQFYYVFYYEASCTDYSIVMIYYMFANGFWIVICFIGAALIRSKQAKKIMVFFVLLVIALLSRIGIYILMYQTMNHYISEETLANCYCQSIYVDELYMIQAIVEAVILLINIVFVKIIHNYILHWETSRSEFFFGSNPAAGNSRLLKPNYNRLNQTGQ